MSKHHLFLAFTNPVPGREAEYNEWQHTVHLPDGLKNPGFVGVKRYRLADAQFVSDAGNAAYVNVWEIESDNLAETLAEAGRRAADTPLSDAMDLSSIRTAIYTLDE